MYTKKNGGLNHKLHDTNAGFTGSDQFALSGIYNGVSAATSTRLSCVNLNAKEAGRNVVPGCNWRGSDGWEDWFLQFVMAASVALITVAALAERASLLGLAFFTAILSAFIYPVVVHWCVGSHLLTGPELLLAPSST